MWLAYQEKLRRNIPLQEETRELPLAIRKAIGFQLDRVQRGETPTAFKPMPTVGSGVYEIRVDGENGGIHSRDFKVRLSNIQW
jgi:phage-related protein